MSASASAETPRNFADWNRQVVDVRLSCNGGRQVGWMDAGLRLVTGDGGAAAGVAYNAVMSLQSGGYGDILLAVPRASPGSDDGDSLRELSRAETEAARSELRALAGEQRGRLAVLKVPKKCLSRQATEKAFRKAIRALNELRDSEVPGVALMQDYSRRHCVEVYRFYPCDLAAAAREMLGSRHLNGAIPETFLFFWAVQLAEAITTLHERGILHCDLHPENVLLDCDGNLLLHDFGLSKRLPEPLLAGAWRRRAAWVKIPRKFREDARQFALLEAGWWPPELAEAFRGRAASGHMNHTVDWWGLGATLFRLRTGTYPMRHFTEPQLARMLERPACQLTPNFSHFLLQLLRERIPDRLGHAGDGREVLSHVCVRASPLFRGCDSWEQRRLLVRSRQLPLPYRVAWAWPDFLQRPDSDRLPQLA